MCMTTCKEKLDYCHGIIARLCVSTVVIKLSSTLPEKLYLATHVRLTKGEVRSIATFVSVLLTVHCRLVPLAIPAGMFIRIDLEYNNLDYIRGWNWLQHHARSIIDRRGLSISLHELKLGQYLCKHENKCWPAAWDSYQDSALSVHYWHSRAVPLCGKMSGPTSNSTP